MATLPTAMKFDDLVAVVDEMLTNADNNGHAVWDQSVDWIIGDLSGYSDDILACAENDIRRAVETALEKRKAMAASQ